jgi:hypothetical protein
MKYTLIIILLINCFTFAQDQINHSFWAEIGTGVSFIKLSDDDAGFNYFGSLNYEINNNNFSLSYLNSREFLSFNHPEEYIKSFELKYGRSIDFSMRGLIFPFPLLLILKKDFDYSLIGKIGISYNEGLKRTVLLRDELFNNNYDSKITTGFGLPIEIELREEITSFIGMGLSLYVNFNKVKNYSGFNFNIYIGQF